MLKLLLKSTTSLFGHHSPRAHQLSIFESNERGKKGCKGKALKIDDGSIFRGVSAYKATVLNIDTYVPL